MERRSTLYAPVMRGKNDRGRKIAGYAAVFYRGDPGTEYRYGDVVERILPGAFDGLLDGDVLALFNHDRNQVLGRQSNGALTLKADDTGLYYSVIAGTTIGRNVAELVARGDVAGSSFSFDWGVTRDVRDGDDGDVVREIISFEAIYDVGPVTVPAYEGTTAAARARAVPGWYRKLADMRMMDIRGF